MIKIRTFTQSAQTLFDRALFMAEKLHYNYLGTEHFVPAFLSFETKAGFNLYTKGLDVDAAEKYLADYIEKFPEYKYGGPETRDYITVNSLSGELTDLINGLLAAAKAEGRYVDFADLANALFDNDTEFKAVIDEFLNKPTPSVLPKNLAKFGKNLVEEAADGKLDPVIGRKEEINQVINILLRKNKRNPCLIGDAGVGKTAIVEGLALRIAEGNVPARLKGKIVYSINMNTIIAGTKYRGDFEQRMKTVLDEVEKSNNIIMFIDEIHTLGDAGSSENGVNALNILKPSLARGSLQLIGATTTEEYKKTIERDSAFARRMQSVLIDEPSVEEAIEILDGVRPSYESFHGVKTADDVVAACVTLSKRYISDRFLPDKAITVYDETAANVSSRGDQLITKQDICDTIQKTTGINVSDLTKSENSKLAAMESELNAHVIGQEEAVSVVAKALKRSRVGIRNPDRPIGSFLFVGPTGVGKTELGKTIAMYLNGTEKSLIKLDMSEYMEKHSVSKIIGSPPGYVGFDDGGQLTERVKRNPYSVIIFDEIEKAHPDVSDILLQILDEGTLTDARGVKINFKNTVIVITSNIGSDKVSSSKGSIGFSADSEAAKTANTKDIITSAIKDHFRPEFLNRIDNIVVFGALGKDTCRTIAKNMLDELSKRIAANGYNVFFDQTVIDAVVNNGFDEKMGARNIKREIQTLVEDSISDAVINEEIVSGETYDIKIKNDILSFTKVTAKQETEESVEPATI